MQPPPSCTHPWADLPLDRPGPLARLRALPFLQRGASFPSTHLRSAQPPSARSVPARRTNSEDAPRCWNGCKMVRRDLAEWVTTALINCCFPTEETRCCPLKHSWLAWRCLPVVMVAMDKIRRTNCFPVGPVQVRGLHPWVPLRSSITRCTAKKKVLILLWTSLYKMKFNLYGEAPR